MNKYTKNPLVSVIIPTYNVEEYIEECIVSIQKQTYENLEIVVVDDCSSDNTFEILCRLAKDDTRIKVFKNDKNMKICYSLNKALENSLGEYIVRMDGDDVSSLDRIEMQLNYLQKNKDIDLVGLGTINIDEYGNEISRTEYAEKFETLKKIAKYASPVLHIWMTKKSIYEELRGYREMPYVEDYDFLLRMITSGYKFANIPNYFGYKVRTRIGNTASTVGIKQRKAFEYARELYKYRLDKKESIDFFDESDYYNYIKSSKLEEEKYSKSLYLIQKSRRLKSEGKKTWVIYTIKSIFNSKYQFKYIYRAIMTRIIKILNK